jgi:multiple sugar transport system permease protein
LAVIAVATAKRRGSLGTERAQEALAGYAFIAIPLILFLVFNIGSLFYSAYISLWRWGILGPTDFLGFRNYQFILRDDVFHTAIRNSIYYTIVVVPIQMALGLLLAVVVNQIWRGRPFFRAAFYFPAIASSAAITVLYIYIMNPDGLFNHVLQLVGLDPATFPNQGDWLGHQKTAMNSIIALNAWTTSGTMMLFYLGQLTSIPTEVYEAARVDGAGAWTAFWRITFPLLRPAHYLVASLSVIGALQMFDQAIIAGGTDGSPNYSLMTIVLYLYNATIKQYEFGYAAAVGIVLFAIIFTATVVQRQLFGSSDWAAAR